MKATDLGWAAAMALVAALAVPASAAEPVGTMVRGDTVAEFDALAVDGVSKHIAYPKDSATVIVFFLSGCPTCHKMIPQWNRAYERRPGKLNVIGVLMDREPPGFFDAIHIAFPVVRSPGRDFLQLWKVNRAPMTVRVGPGGTVQDVEVGIVDPIRLGEIFRP
jgi:thiol-disulfide isomerase/thioredoxin